jgi:predicted O-methyltransferase YrrM
MSRQPTYTLDTFTKNLPVWEKILDEPYKDSFKHSPTNILDIGAGDGPATIWFAENLIENPKSKVYSVDSWWQRETEKRFDANISDSGLSYRIVKLKGSVPHTLCEQVVKNTKYTIINYNYSTNSVDAFNILSIAFSLLLKDDGILVINNIDVEHKINPLGGFAVHYKEALGFLQRLYAGRFEVISTDKLLILKKLTPEQLI